MEHPKTQSNDHLWSRHWYSPGGESLLSYGRQDRSHWIRFPTLADFKISADAEEISCYPSPDIPRETIRHLLLDQILPRCLAHQGKIMLHASAVQLEQGILLLIGDSGAGKSTLAGNFHQMGQPVLSDDCVWVKENTDRIRAVPTYGGLRLWEDSLKALFTGEQTVKYMAHYSMKKRVSLGEHNINMHEFQQELPVLAVIALSVPGEDPVSDIIIEPLSRREAFIELMKQSFQLDLMDMERMTRHVQALGRIVPRLPAYRLSMPHDYALLPLVRQKILETVL